jgi:hypothetical protein
MEGESHGKGRYYADVVAKIILVEESGGECKTGKERYVLVWKRGKI